MLEESHTIGRFTFRAMDEAAAREIAAWRHDPPYERYGSAPDSVEETVRCLLEPAYRYCSVWDEAGELIGNCGFGEDGRVPGGDYRADALDVGGGLRPDRTGQGLGAGFLEASMELARRHLAPAAFRVTVAAFNQRALRLCERLGYRRVQTFESEGSREPFVVLVRDAG